MFRVVFDRATARPPKGLEPPAGWTSSDPDWRDRLLEFLDQAPSEGAQVVRMGYGNFMVVKHDDDPKVSIEENADVVALVRGEIKAWPGIDDVTDAHDAFILGEPLVEHASNAKRLVRLYETLMEQSHGERDVVKALESLAQVEGGFAFMLLDRMRGNVLIARDSEGAETVYWGCMPDGSLTIGDSWSTLGDCTPSAIPFPAGCLFINEGTTLSGCPGAKGWVTQSVSEAAWPGRLHCFARIGRAIRAVPRVNSAGAICGHMFRVASGADLKTKNPDVL